MSKYLLLNVSEVFNVSNFSFGFICLSALMFVIGLFLRIFKARKASRICQVIGAIFLVAYASLVFVDIASIIKVGDWTMRDVADIIFFGVSLIIFAHTLGMAIKKS